MASRDSGHWLQLLHVAQHTPELPFFPPKMKVWISTQDEEATTMGHSQSLTAQC